MSTCCWFRPWLRYLRIWKLGSIVISCDSELPIRPLDSNYSTNEKESKLFRGLEEMVGQDGSLLIRLVKMETVCHEEVSQRVS
jgi:hypothetical protein